MSGKGKNKRVSEIQKIKDEWIERQTDIERVREMWGGKQTGGGKERVLNG